MNIPYVEFDGLSRVLWWTYAILRYAAYLGGLRALYVWIYQ